MKISSQFLILVHCWSTSNIVHTENEPNQNAIIDDSKSSASGMAAPKVHRGGNYTSDEDVFIAREYVEVSKEAIEVSDPKGTHYYLRTY